MDQSFSVDGVGLGVDLTLVADVACVHDVGLAVVVVEVASSVASLAELLEEVNCPHQSSCRNRAGILLGEQTAHACILLCSAWLDCLLDSAE